MLRFGLLLLGLLVLAGGSAGAEDEGGFLGLHDLDLGIGDDQAVFALDVSGHLDVEGYAIGDEAPGLVSSDRSLVQPRLTVFLNARVGEHLFLAAQARVDRGFDPDDHPVQVRADEYLARWTESGEDWSASLQVGKFATVLGNFVGRHDPMRSPLVRAPLPYDFMTPVWDSVAPADVDGQIGYREIEDEKNDWVPMLWGPVYHTGAMVFGTVGDFDLRVAATNAAPCERPEEWTWQKDDEEALAWSVRAGWRAFPGFVAGVNWARGAFMRREAADALGDSDRRDFRQSLVGIDLEYRIGHLEMWAEVYGSSWEVSRVAEPLRALAGYVEARYSFTPRFYLAARWGMIHFDEVRDLAGNRTEWDRDAWRAELGAGYEFAANLLLKAQYEVNEQIGGREPHDDMASFSLSVGF